MKGLRGRLCIGLALIALVVIVAVWAPRAGGFSRETLTGVKAVGSAGCHFTPRFGVVHVVGPGSVRFKADLANGIATVTVCGGYNIVQY